jgi:hypothetical protein
MKAIDRMIQRRRIDMAAPYLGPGQRVLDISCAESGYRTLQYRGSSVTSDRVVHRKG